MKNISLSLEVPPFFFYPRPCTSVFFFMLALLKKKKNPASWYATVTVCLLVQSCLSNRSSSHNPKAPPIHSSPAPCVFLCGFCDFCQSCSWLNIYTSLWLITLPRPSPKSRGKLFCNIQIINMYLYLRLFCINVKSCRLHGVLDMCVYVVLPHWKTTIVLY